MHDCPKKLAAKAWAAIPLFELFGKGVLPVAGGVLDQSAWFIEAERFYAADVENVKAELMRDN